MLVSKGSDGDLCTVDILGGGNFSDMYHSCRLGLFSIIPPAMRQRTIQALVYEDDHYKVILVLSKTG